MNGTTDFVNVQAFSSAAATMPNVVTNPPFNINFSGSLVPGLGQTGPASTVTGPTGPTGNYLGVIGTGATFTANAGLSGATSTVTPQMRTRW